jgi:hypothetical protein
MASTKTISPLTAMVLMTTAYFVLVAIALFAHHTEPLCPRGQYARFTETRTGQQFFLTCAGQIER